MRVTYWLVGCALCIAGIGNAMAASSETQGQDSSSHATLESTSSHDDNSGSGGDALGLNRDCPSARGSDNPGSTSGNGNGNDRSGGGSSGSMPARRLHLGWQSLLPGSIQ